MSLGLSAAAWAGIGAVGSVAVSAYGASKAGDAQEAAAGMSADATLQAQREALAAQQPFLKGGYAGTNRLQELLGVGGNTGAQGYGSLNEKFSFNPGDLTQTPGYQFQLQQGQEALDRKAAAGGGFYSGAALKASQGFGQDLASTTFDKEYNRAFNAFQTDRANTLNPLQALAGQGQTAANNVSGIQQNTGNALSNLYTGLGNAQGASAIAQGNAIGGGISNGLSAWQQANYLSQLQQPAQSTFGMWGAGGGVNPGSPWGG
jgi:hypothetical protein